MNVKERRKMKIIETNEIIENWMNENYKSKEEQSKRIRKMSILK